MGFGRPGPCASVKRCSGNRGGGRGPVGLRVSRESRPSRSVARFERGPTTLDQVVELWPAQPAPAGHAAVLVPPAREGVAGARAAAVGANEQPGREPSRGYGPPKRHRHQVREQRVGATPSRPVSRHRASRPGSPTGLGPVRDVARPNLIVGHNGGPVHRLCWRRPQPTGQPGWCAGSRGPRYKGHIKHGFSSTCASATGPRRGRCGAVVPIIGAGRRAVRRPLRQPRRLPTWKMGAATGSGRLAQTW